MSGSGRFFNWYRGSRGPGFRNQHGTTLIELLISSLIGLIVVASGFEIYLTQHRNWVIQDEVTDAQQSARVSIKMLSRHMRMAGYGLPDGMMPIIAENNDPDAIMILYQPPGGCQATLRKDMTGVSTDLFCNDQDLLCFKVNGWGYIHDPSTDSGEFFVITEVKDAPNRILHQLTPLSKEYPEGSLVLMIEAYRFYVDGPDSTCPMLMVERMGQAPEPFADNVEDLQFRYVMQNGDTLDIPNLPDLVRRILVTITTRTARADLQFEGEYRRRQFATEVQVRNLGF